MTNKKTTIDDLENDDNIDYSIFGDEIKLSQMNKRHAFIESIGGKPMILSYTYNNVYGKEIIEFRSVEAIEKFYSNSMIELDRGKLITLGKWWLGNSSRRQYSGVIFDPSKPKEYKYNENYTVYNLWEGFNCVPKKGNWKHTKKHIWKVLSNKNKEKFKYIMRWFAWCIQNPSERAQVALVLKGKEGAGKGFIFSQFVEIFGRHGMHIASRNHLTGKFSGHLSLIVFLFADEAYYPGDKEVEGTLKQLITENKVTREAKNKEAILDKNMLHIGMATNNDWVIPATGDSRRYFINEVDNMYAKNQTSDDNRKIYFNKLWGEMAANGREAMLNDMLNMDLKNWKPWENVPETKELHKQSILSLSRTHKAILSMIEDGMFPGEYTPNGEYLVSATILWDYLGELEPRLGEVSARVKAEIIKELNVKKVQKSSGNYWIFPALDIIRRIWVRKFGKVEWEGTTEWQIRKSAY